MKKIYLLVLAMLSLFIANAQTSELTFTETAEIAELEGKTVRRMIVNGDYMYVLALDANNEPYIYIINVDTNDVTVVSTTGINTPVSTSGLKISDIAVTEDGFLVACSKDLVVYNGTGLLYVYKWENTNGIPAGNPTQWKTFNFAARSSYGYMATTMAWRGTFANGTSLYASDAANSSEVATGSIRILQVTTVDGEVQVNSNNGGATNSLNVSSASSNIWNHTTYGTTYKFSVSPVNRNNFIIDGNSAVPTEFSIEGAAYNVNCEKIASLTSNLTETTDVNASYFKCAGSAYMVAPTSTGISLINVTEGLASAETLATATIENLEENAHTAGRAVIDDNVANIELYLLHGNNISKYTTATEPISSRRVYAYNLKQEEITTTIEVENNDVEVKAYKITFNTNTEANEAVVTLSNGDNEIAVAATSDDNMSWEAIVDPSVGNFEANANYTWNVKVSAYPVKENVNFYSKGFNRPSTLAIDKNPDSDLFGNIYLSENVGASTHGTSTGLYSANASLLDAMACHTVDVFGDGSGNANRSSKPRAIAVGNDGQIYVSACGSDLTGIYNIDPTNGYTSTKLYEAAAYGLGVKDNNIYYVTANSESGYDINKMTTAGTSNEMLFTSVINDNSVNNSTYYKGYNAIVPMEHGMWVNYSDYNALDGNQLHFVDYSGSIKWSVGDSKVKNDRSGLGVDERNGLVVYYDRTNTNLSAYKFSFDENGNISVGEKQTIGIGATPGRVEACAFDYAGNLYLVSSYGEWFKGIALPTDDNTCTTPAKTGTFVSFTGDDIATGVEGIAVDANAPVEYYNMQGVKVANPENGIFIKKQGNKTTKVVL